ncbi:MAG: hypothetical protein V2A69_00850 [Pseudomonadota bacterium]
MFVTKIGVALRDMVESLGPVGTKVAIREMLKKKELKPEDFTSFQEIWAACERDKMGNVRHFSEAVSSDLFPVITGEIISAKIIAGYDSIKRIGDMLTTTMTSKMKTATYAGFTASKGPDVVLEGAPYNDSGLDEKWASISHTKYGRIISVTEETILFDQTGQVLVFAGRIGEKAALYKEKLTVEGIQDINSNVYKPAGVATAFYRSTASGDRKINLATSAPFGEAGLLALKKVMDAMTDEEGDYITLGLGQLYGLFPVDLEVRVKQMLNSTLVPEGVSNATNTWKGWFTPLASPYVSGQSTSAWYVGDFRQDFIWSEVWPLQTFTAKPGHEDEFNRDIKSKTKVRFYGEIGAVDDKHSFKCTA